MEKQLFTYEIRNLNDWGRVFQDQDAFLPLTKEIFRKCNLEFKGLDNCTPGSNAVFKCGKYIVKIFAPEESEIGSETDYHTEAFGIRRANELAIAAPKLVASGEIFDKYLFRYLVMEYVEGESLADVSGKLSKAERIKIGGQLRRITEQMDTPCECFNDHFLFSEAAERRWEAFSEKFRQERHEYLAKHPRIEDVYVHGDLNPDNILVDSEGKICIIDFADALLAPIELELAAVICEGFRFDPDYMQGFLGEYEKEELADCLLFGLLIHDFGVNIIRDNIADPAVIDSIEELKMLLLAKTG